MTVPLNSQRHLDRRHDLLICLAIMYHPSYDMPTLRVMVRPMDDAAFVVPDILAVEADAVAYLSPSIRGAMSML